MNSDTEIIFLERIPKEELIKTSFLELTERYQRIMNGMKENMLDGYNIDGVMERML